MRYIWLLVLMLPPLSAQDGAAIYKERCAACHDAPEGRVPALSAIKAMSGEAIYAALTTGVMKTQAAGLSTGAALRADRLHRAHRRLAAHASRLDAHLQRRCRLPAGRRIRRNGTGGAPALPTRDSKTRPRRGSQPPTFPSSSSSGRSIWAT